MTTHASSRCLVLLALVLGSGCHEGTLGGGLDLRCARCDPAADGGAGANDGALDDDGSGGGGSHAGADASDLEHDRADAAMQAGAEGDASTLQDAAANDAGGDSVPAQFEYVAPHVVFTDEAPRLRVFGSALLSAEGRAVFVDGQALGTFHALSDREGWFTLDGALGAGEHSVQVAAASRPGRPGARLFAAKRMQYADAELELPGFAEALLYDPERRAFFGVIGGRLSRIRFDGLRWRLDELDLPAPLALTLTPDGRELLVTQRGAVLAHVGPDAFELLSTENLPALGERYGAIHALADGQVLCVDTYGWTSVWEYPSQLEVGAPSSYSLLSLLSQDQTRLLWADALDSFLPEGTAFAYQAALREFEEFRFLGGKVYFNSLAISGDGQRIAQLQDIYDGSYNYLGSLDTDGANPHAVGLSMNGSVAAAYMYEEELRAYDLRADTGPFSPIGEAIPFPQEELGVTMRLFVDEAGVTAFAFTQRTVNLGLNEVDYHFVVRALPR